MIVVVLVEPGGAGAAARAALALAANLVGAEQVIALSAGPPHPERRAPRVLATPGARRVRVVDSHLAGASPSSLAQALVAAIRRLEATLILAGTASDREGRGIIPACVAHALGATYLAAVEEVTRSADALTAVALAGGSRCRLAITLPAVLTVAPGSLLPSVVLPMTAQTLSLADLDIHARSLTADAALLGALVQRSRKRPAAARSAADLRRRLR